MVERAMNILFMLHTYFKIIQEGMTFRYLRSNYDDL